MIYLGISVIFVSLLFLPVLKEKVERRIFILFNLFWVALLLLSYAIPYGDHKISDQTYFIFSVFLISINFGYLNGKIFLKKEGAGIAQENKVFDFDSVLSNKIIIMYLTIIMALYVFYGIRYTTVTNEIGGVEARNLRFFVGPLFPTTIELLIFNYIISPTRFLASLIVALEVYKEKFKIIPTSICLVIIFLSTYIGGGRFEIMYFLLCLLLAFVIKPPCVKFKNDGDITCYPKGFLFRAIIIIAGLAMIIVAAYVTGYRRNQTSFEDFDLFENIGILFEQFTEYTVGSLGAFDVAMDTGIIENRFYLGRASVIGGIEELIQFFLRTIGVNFYSARTEIGVLFNDGVQVGKETFMALYTALAYFWFDCGILGIVAFSCIWGGCVRIFVVKRNDSFIYMAILFHAFYQYMLLSYNWYFTGGESIMYFAMLWIISQQKSKTF